MNTRTAISPFRMVGTCEAGTPEPDLVAQIQLASHDLRGILTARLHARRNQTIGAQLLGTGFVTTSLTTDVTTSLTTDVTVAANRRKSST